MHIKKAYEETITSKLEALPVPDMADAIWARIEAQLDLDMPTDDGGGNGPSSPAGGSWTGKVGLFIFVAALILSFFFYNNRKNNPAIPAITNTDNRAAIDSTTLINPDPQIPEPPAITETPPPIPQGSRLPEVVAAPIDSSPVPGAGPPPVTSDSIQQSTALTPPLVKLPDDTTAPKRKSGRGVSGINDDDYRIKPKKDSTP